MEDAGLGRDDELLLGARARALDQAARRGDECGVAKDAVVALRMRDHLGLGILRDQLEQAALAERLVDDAGTFPQHEVRAIRLLLHERTEVAIRREHDLLIAERLDDLHRVGRRADHVRERLHLGRAVDVADDRVARVALQPVLERGRGAAIGERAACLEVRDDHDLVRVQDLRGLGHEVNAAERDHIGLGPGGGLRELERITDEIGEVLDLGLLVVVRQDHRVALLLEPPDLRLELLVAHIQCRCGGAVVPARHRNNRELVHEVSLP